MRTLYDFIDGMAQDCVDGKWGFTRCDGVLVVPYLYDEVNDFNYGMAAVKRSGKWGYVDINGNEVIPPQFDRAGYFRGETAVVGMNGSRMYADAKWGMVDKAGNLVAPLIYDDCGHSDIDYTALGIECEPVGEAKRAYKYDMFDSSGKKILSQKYSHMRGFHDGLAKVELDGKYGFIDKSGKEVAPPIYDYVLNFYEDSQIYDYSNRESEPDFTYYFLEDYRHPYLTEGVFMVKLHGKWGCINKHGKYVVKPQFDYMSYFYEGMARVTENGKWGFVNKSGDIAIPLQYDSVENFRDGLALVHLNDKYGHIDKTGKPVGEFTRITSDKSIGYPKFDDARDPERIYDGIYRQSDGMSKVSQNGKWGYIDETYKLAIPVQYDLANRFKNGMACVELDGKWGCIDKNGNTVIPFIYTFLKNYEHHDLLKAKRAEHWGYIDRAGKEVIPFDFDEEVRYYDSEDDYYYALKQKRSAKTVCKIVFAILHKKWVKEKSNLSGTIVGKLLDRLRDLIDGDIHVLSISNDLLSMVVVTGYENEVDIQSFVRDYFINNFDVYRSEINDVVTVNHMNIGLLEAEQLIRNSLSKEQELIFYKLSKNELLNVSIEELDFSERAFNCLKRANVKTVADVLTHTKESLMKINKLSRISADEIIFRMAKFGLSLPESDAEDNPKEG